MKVDYHMHTQWSQDGRMSLVEALETCTARGVEEVAITEHVDMVSPYSDDGVADLADCFAEIERQRPRFPKVRILRGVEAGVHRDNLEATSKLVEKFSPDFVIASVHSFPCGALWNREAGAAWSPRDYLRAYLEEALFVVTHFEPFCVLGHIDYPMRYHAMTEEDFLSCGDVVEKILATLARRGRGIEINLAGLGRLGRPHPAPWVLERFRSLGGTLVTIGSDSHSTTGIGRHWDEALALLRNNGFPAPARFSGMKAL